MASEPTLTPRFRRTRGKFTFNSHLWLSRTFKKTKLKSKKISWADKQLGLDCRFKDAGLSPTETAMDS